MKRRDFLWRLPVLRLGTACVGVALATTGCASVRYVTGRDGNGRVLVPVSAFEGGPDVVVESSLTPRPLYLRRADDGAYTALLLRCTHRGCQPEPTHDRLECPCHGSEFSFDGRVLRGPAEQALRRYPARVEGNEVVIDLGSRP